MRNIAFTCLCLFAVGCTADGGPVPNRITALTPETHDLFPIEQGTAHGENVCNECHGGLPSFSMFLCTDCHRHTAERTNPTHASVPDYQFQSESCYACHPDGTALVTAEGHVWFPITEMTFHTAIGCNECHIEGQPRSQFDCLQCHEPQSEYDPIHTGVSGYVYASTECYQCHPTGEGAGGYSRENHTPFPIDVGSNHETTNCSDCHATSGFLAGVSCADCHRAQTPGIDASHSGVSEYVGNELNSPLCMKCHAEGTVPITTSQHSGNGVDINLRHDECLGCHNTLAAGYTFEAADFVPFSCDGACHQHPQQEMDRVEDHERSAEYSYDFPTCLNCHPDGDKE